MDSDNPFWTVVFTDHQSRAAEYGRPLAVVGNSQFLTCKATFIGETE